MSSRGRSSAGYEPDPTDFFQTPNRATRIALPFVDDLIAICGRRMDGEGMRILEPCCGEGAIGRVLRVRYPAANIYGYEIDAGRAAVARKAKIGTGKHAVRVFNKVVTGDFLKMKAEPLDPFDIAITNPSFTICVETAERCFEFADWTVLLMRLNFLGSKKRAAWWRRHRAALKVLSERPSFAVSVRCKRGQEKCSYQEVIGRDPETEEPVRPIPRECPTCAAAGIKSGTKITSSDSTEYCWSRWIGSGRQPVGTWEVPEFAEEAASDEEEGED